MPSEYDMDENGEQRLLTTLVRFDPHVVFDAGANGGEWSVRAEAAFPNAAIHAFEIVPSTYKKLADRVSMLHRVISNPFGLSDQNGEVDVNVDYPGSGHSSIFPLADDRPVTITRCFVESGDSYVRRNGIEHVDVLKMDVEGA